MCGIFGITINNQSNIGPKDCKKIFNKLFLLSESRGKEASGFASNDGCEIKVFKAPFPAYDTVKTSTYNLTISQLFDRDYEYVTVIGHSRLVTNGYEQYNQNNQPVIKNNMVGIHNGIIVNESELWEKYKDEFRFSDLDSELIPTLIRRHYNSGKKLKDAIKSMYHEIYGMTSIAFLFADLQNLLLATNNGSLYYMLNSDKNAFVFASERYILQTLVKNNGLKQYFNSAEITSK